MSKLILLAGTPDVDVTILFESENMVGAASNLLDLLECGEFDRCRLNLDFF